MRLQGLILALALVSSACIAGALQAQEHATDRGSYIFGGSAGLSSHKAGESSRSTYMHMSPSVQYFVQPGLAIGGTLSLAHARYDAASMTTYGAGPTVSYYLGDGSQSLRPYLSGRTIYAGVSGSSGHALTYGGKAGVLYLFTRSVGLDASLFYDAWSQRGSGFTSRSDAFGVALGFSAFAF
jgi:hypothetical protein